MARVWGGPSRERHCRGVAGVVWKPHILPTLRIKFLVCDSDRFSAISLIKRPLAFEFLYLLQPPWSAFILCLLHPQLSISLLTTIAGVRFPQSLPSTGPSASEIAGELPLSAVDSTGPQRGRRSRSRKRHLTFRTRTN